MISPGARREGGASPRTFRQPNCARAALKMGASGKPAKDTEVMDRAALAGQEEASRGVPRIDTGTGDSPPRAARSPPARRDPPGASPPRRCAPAPPMDGPLPGGPLPYPRARPPRTPADVGPVYLKVANRVRRVGSVPRTEQGVLTAFADEWGLRRKARPGAGDEDGGRLGARPGDVRLWNPHGVWLTEFSYAEDLAPEAILEWILDDLDPMVRAEQDAIAKYEEMLEKRAAERRRAALGTGPGGGRGGNRGALASTSGADRAPPLALPGAPPPRAYSMTSGGFNRALIGRGHYEDARGAIIPAGSGPGGRPGRRPWQLRLRSFLDDPESSFAAKIWTWTLLVLIFMSTLTFCLESIPTFTLQAQSPSSAWFIMEAAAISIFSIEIVARFVAYGSVRTFLSKPMNLVDLVAVLPFYVELIVNAVTDADVPGFQVLRVLRLTRVFRLFKASRGSLIVLTETMRRSAKPMYMLIFLVWLGLMIFSSIIYYAERGDWDDALQVYKIREKYRCSLGLDLCADGGLEDCSLAPRVTLGRVADLHPGCAIAATFPGEPWRAELECSSEYVISTADSRCTPVYVLSKFASIPASLWWCIVTMVTVGYGDLYPVTAVGKMFASLLMLFGILVLGLPISVIGANFTAVYKTKLRRNRVRDTADAYAAEGEIRGIVGGFRKKLGGRVASVFKNMREARDARRSSQGGGAGGAAGEGGGGGAERGGRGSAQRTLDRAMIRAQSRVA